MRAHSQTQVGISPNQPPKGDAIEQFGDFSEVIPQLGDGTDEEDASRQQLQRHVTRE